MNFQYLHQGGLSSTSTVQGPFRKDHDWPLFFKFLAISSVATFASIGNIFTISAIIIDDLLRKKGNSFLVSVTLADLLATTFMLPASSVAILSQMENSENLCRFQYAVAEMSCVTAAVFTAVVGIENFLRLSTLQQVEKHRRRRQHHQQQQQQQQQRQQQQQQRQQQHSHHHHQSHHHGHGSGSVSSTTPAAASSTTTPRSATITIQILPANERSNAPAPPSPPPVSPYRCSQFQVTVLNLTLWVISGSLVLFHVLLWPQPMYAVCGFFDDRGLDRESLIHSLMIFAICFTTFLLVGGLGFLKCVCIMKSWDRPKPYLISREFALVTSNCWNWLARFLIWCPSLLIAIISHSQESSNSSVLPIAASTSATMTVASSTDAAAMLHHVGSSNSLSSNIISSTVSPLLLLSGNGVHHTNSSRITASELISLQGLLLWPAILPPCLSSLINALSNKDFRRCYIQLFHYCCCKTSVALTRRSRDNLRGGSDVRVHIIPGYNIYNSGTTGHFNEVAATPPRFNTFKYGSLMACRRDVYEL